MLFFYSLTSEVIEYDNLHPMLIDMAARRPQKDSRQPKPKKKRRKMRLSLRQSKIKKSDSYTDSIGWSKTGRVLEDAPKPKEPETLTIQCDMCGCRLKIPKPKKQRYTVSCSYPECGNIMKFN